MSELSQRVHDLVSEPDVAFGSDKKRLGRPRPREYSGLIVDVVVNPGDARRARSGIGQILRHRGNFPEQVMREFAEIWRGRDKLVYSRTLEAVSSARTTLAREFNPDQIRELKAEDEDLVIGRPRWLNAKSHPPVLR